VRFNYNHRKAKRVIALQLQKYLQYRTARFREYGIEDRHRTYLRYTINFNYCLRESEVEEEAKGILIPWLRVVSDKLMMKKALLTCHYKMITLQSKIRNFNDLKRLRLKIIEN
jgi:hypothetical protein